MEQLEKWVELERRGSVAIMTLTRTYAMNALNTPFMHQILEALDEVEKDHSIYVLIITGSGKSFIAGADIKEWNSLTPPEAVEWSKLIQDVNNRIEELRIPVIAAINGFALGGGCELAMACDIRMASEKAKFGQPEAGLGVIAGAGGTQRLPRIIGMSMAKKLLYTGRAIQAEEALRIGLIDELTTPEELMDKALALAEEIASNGQIAVQQTKRVVNAGIRSDIDAGFILESQAFGLCIGTEDKRIGANAFINKEKEKNFVYR